MTWRLRIRNAARRLRRRLGFPALNRRVALLAVLALLGLAFVSATVFADFITKLGEYVLRDYEPRDFEREEWVERQESAKPAGAE